MPRVYSASESSQHPMKQEQKTVMVRTRSVPWHWTHNRGTLRTQHSSGLRRRRALVQEREETGPISSRAVGRRYPTQRPSKQYVWKGERAPAAYMLFATRPRASPKGMVLHRLATPLSCRDGRRHDGHGTRRWWVLLGADKTGGRPREPPGHVVAATPPSSTPPPEGASSRRGRGVRVARAAARPAAAHRCLVTYRSLPHPADRNTSRGRAGPFAPAVLAPTTRSLPRHPPPK